MDYQSLKGSLIYFLDTVSGDIDALENLAMDAAKHDIQVLRQRGELQIPTTSPIGKNLIVDKLLKPRCTVPLTMVCFSVIDVLGKIGDNTSRQASKTDTENSQDGGQFIRHSQFFFKDLAGKDDLKNSSTATILQNAYRHSIAHAFLPAATVETGYSVSYTEQLDGWALIAQVESSKRILNVKYLTAVVKTGISKVRDMLNSSDNNFILDNFKLLLDDNDSRLKQS